MKFCWATIHVRNMEKSLAFYGDVVGLKLVSRSKPNPEMELAFLGEGETQVELICSSRIREPRLGGDFSLGFVVADVAGFHAQLKKREGLNPSEPFSPNPSIRFFYVQDPDGLKIQFVENVAAL